MSAAEREEFLAGVHVGVLSAAIGTAGQTLAVPVWYSYQPGGLLTVLTGRRSRKAAAMRAAATRASTTVSDWRGDATVAVLEDLLTSRRTPARAMGSGGSVGSQCGYSSLR